MPKAFYVTKASGVQEKFKREKLKKTLIRAGASDELADTIVKDVMKRAYNGIPTKAILKIALRILDKHSPKAAAKYDLKGAIMRLGPAGFLFEKLIAEILKEHGYGTKVHSILKGSCVKHEVDIIASKEFKVMKELHEPPVKWYMIECKFHHAPGIFTGVKDVLYTYARFLDLLDGWKMGKTQKFDQAWLSTNTKFSRDAIQYANCKKMLLLGWSYPPDNSLEMMIESKKLYPITVMRNLDDQSLYKLSDARMMLCKDLFKKKPKELKNITGISLNKINTLIQEAEKILE
jgi:hypothetical protein